MLMETLLIYEYTLDLASFTTKKYTREKMNPNHLVGGRMGGRMGIEANVI